MGCNIVSTRTYIIPILNNVQNAKILTENGAKRKIPTSEPHKSKAKLKQISQTETTRIQNFENAPKPRVLLLKFGSRLLHTIFIPL